MNADHTLSLSQDLHRQHILWTRQGYDGHNRRSGFTTMAEIRRRQNRRRWNQTLALWCRSYRASDASLTVARMFAA